MEKDPLIINKNAGKIFKISVVFIALSLLGVYVGHKIHSKLRQQTLSHVIEDLENYKSAHGYYPPSIDCIDNKDTSWLNYLPDSAHHYFILAYAQGGMDVNTISYDSRTKKWTSIFSY